MKSLFASLAAAGLLLAGTAAMAAEGMSSSDPRQGKSPGVIMEDDTTAGGPVYAPGPQTQDLTRPAPEPGAPMQGETGPGAGGIDADRDVGSE